jgi:hypothetical protein
MFVEIDFVEFLIAISIETTNDFFVYKVHIIQYVKKMKHNCVSTNSYSF